MGSKGLTGTTGSSGIDATAAGSSIGVLANAPRFSAYVSSKAALDAFSRCAASEFSDSGVSFTTINMPLVRTPMIAPTRIYENVPTISPDEAAAMVKQAVIYKPQRIATRLGIFAEVLGSDGNERDPSPAEDAQGQGVVSFPHGAPASPRAATVHPADRAGIDGFLDGSQAGERQGSTLGGVHHDIRQAVQ